MKFFSEHEVRKLIEETDIHDGIRGTADEYLPIMIGIELPDNHGRIVDLDKLIANFRKWANAPIRRTNKEIADFLEEYSKDSTILEANE